MTSCSQWYTSAVIFFNFKYSRGDPDCKDLLLLEKIKQKEQHHCTKMEWIMMKPATVRTFLSSALSQQWPIHQLDAKNAFLHGTLSEIVYCCQPANPLVLLTPLSS
jgi:hypothetical protein